MTHEEIKKLARQLFPEIAANSMEDVIAKVNTEYNRKRFIDDFITNEVKEQARKLHINTIGEYVISPNITIQIQRIREDAARQHLSDDYIERIIKLQKEIPPKSWEKYNGRH